MAAENRCPICRAALWAPSSETISYKTCPRCGAELWVLVSARGPLFFLRQPGQSESSFLAALAGSLYGISASEMEEKLKQADSLDLVDIVMDIEDAMNSGRC